MACFAPISGRTMPGRIIVVWKMNRGEWRRYLGRDSNNKKNYTHSCEKKVVCTIEIPWVPTMGTPLFLRNYCFLHILALILILSHTGYSGRKASMSRRANEGSLFVGRLSKSTRVRDLEDIFEPYGRMTRCEIKYGNINN